MTVGTTNKDQIKIRTTIAEAEVEDIKVIFKEVDKVKEEAMVEVEEEVGDRINPTTPPTTTRQMTHRMKVIHN